MIRNLSIKWKLMLSPVVAVIGFGVFLVFVINVGLGNGQRMEQIRGERVPTLLLAERSSDQTHQLLEVLNTVVTTGELDMLDGAVRLRDEVAQNLAVIADKAPADAEVARRAASQLDAFFKSAESLSRDMVEGMADMSTLGERAQEKQRLYDGLVATLEQLKEASRAAFEETIASADAANSNAIYVGLAIGLGLTAVLLAIAVGVTMLLSGQIRRVSASLQEIAEGEGDLTLRLPKLSTDEIGELVHWFNLFIDKLHRAVSQVVAVGDPLADAAEKLRAVADQSARSSAHQQSASTELMSAIDELILSVSNIAQNTAATASSTADADAETRRGAGKVQESISSINALAAEVTQAGHVIVELQNDAANVGGILDVIRGVADQTNLLALNAAIEAARAGEQGRGFAVVADEVRTLASRTQQSTQEIQQVIQNLQSASQRAVTAMSQSEEQARTSVTQAQETGEILGVISGRVTSIADMSHQIAAATEQQDQTTRAIQQSIRSLMDAADAVFSSTSEVNDLSEGLRQSVRQLGSVASQFKV